MTALRIGHGYDIHRTVAGRPLVLGGVKFDTPFGLDGHSDADALTHAICDALLGAAGLPDIGHQFPNTDPAYKNADSQVLLSRVVAARTLDMGVLEGSFEWDVVREDGVRGRTGLGYALARGDKQMSLTGPGTTWVDGSSQALGCLGFQSVTPKERDSAWLK